MVSKNYVFLYRAQMRTMHVTDFSAPNFFIYAISRSPYICLTNEDKGVLFRVKVGIWTIASSDHHKIPSTLFS